MTYRACIRQFSVQRAALDAYHLQWAIGRTMAPAWTSTGVSRSAHWRHMPAGQLAAALCSRAAYHEMPTTELLEALS